MPPIKHTQLFDFPAYQAAIKEARIASEEFGKSLESVISRLQKEQKRLNDELRSYAAIIKSFSASQAGATDAMKNYNKQVDDSIAHLSELKLLQKGLAQVVDISKSSVAQLEAELKGLQAQYKALKPGQADYDQQLTNINKRVQEIVPRVNAMNTAFKNAKNTVNAAEGSYKAMQAQLGRLRDQLRNMPNAFDAVTGKLNKTNKEAVALAKEISKLDNALKNADKQMGIYVRNIGNYKSALEGFRYVWGKILAVVGFVQAAFQSLQFVFQSNLEFDNVQAALRAVSGSTEEFAINMTFLRRTADHLGLDMMDLAKSFKSFYASAHTAGLGAQQTRDIFEQISRVGARLKLSNDQINGTFIALGQIMSKGKVQAEELRGQLGERIPGAFAIAAKAMGVTSAELDKMLKAGQVIASDFLPKFADQMDKTFGGGTDRVEGLQAAVNRFNNELKSIVTDESGGLNMFFAKVINFFTKALEGADRFFQKIFDHIDPTAAKLRDLERAYGDAYSDNIKKDIHEVALLLQHTREELIKQQKILNQLRAENLHYNDKEHTAALQRQTDIVKELEARRNGMLTAFNQLLHPEKPTTPTAEEFEKMIRDQQAYYEKLAQLDQQYNELAFVRGEKSETEFQERKFQIVEEMTDKITALELRLGKNADQARLTDFKKRLVDAQVELEKFYEKTAPRPSMPAAVARTATPTSGGGAAVSSLSDQAKLIDQYYQSLIGQENAAYSIAKRNRKAKYNEEKEHLEKLLKLNEEAANKIGLKDVELARKYEQEKSEIKVKQAELDNQRKREIEQAAYDTTQELATGLLTILQNAETAKFDKKISQLEREREKELAAAGSNAAAKERINAEYDRKVAQQKKKQAKAEKNNALFEIAINTAVAIAKASPNPYLIAFAVAIGAIQAAVVASKPIPEFRKGTKNAPKGPAKINEEGFEFIEKNGRLRALPGKDRIVNLEGGEKIHTHAQSKRMLDRAMERDYDRDVHLLHRRIKNTLMTGRRNEQVEIMAAALRSPSAGELREAFKSAVREIPIQQTVWDERGMTRRIRKQNATITYLNDQHTL